MCQSVTQPEAECGLLLTCVQLADEHWGVIGVKFKQTSCDKLGPIEGSDSSSGNNEGKSNNGSQDSNTSSSSQDSNNSSQGNNSSQDGKQDSGDKQDPLKEFKGWDDSWIKQKVSSWDKLEDDDFEKHWEDLTDDTWASKFKQEKPSWVK
jgi:hypothetical protein